MRNWKVWLGIVVSVVCVWWAFSGVLADPEKRRTFWEAIRHANLLVCAVAGLWVMGVIWVRAVRWRMLLRHIKPIRVWTLFEAESVGFAVNNLLPARIGELARCYSLRRVEGVPFSSLLASVVAERMWDGISIFACVAVLFAVRDFPGIEEVLGVSQNKVLTTFGVLTGVVLAVFVVFRYFSALAMRITRTLVSVFPKRIADKVLEIEETFIQGFQGIRGVGDWFALSGLSIFIWVISAFGIWLVGLSFGWDHRLSHDQVIVVMVAIIAAVSAPTAPGYVGLYHVFGMQALVRWGGMQPGPALAVASVIHLVNYLPQTVFGLWALKRQGMDLSEVRKAGEQGAEKEPISRAVTDSETGR